MHAHNRHACDTMIVMRQVMIYFGDCVSFRASYILSTVLKVGLPILEAELKNLNIPDVSGDAHLPIGHIEYSLSK